MEELLQRFELETLFARAFFCQTDIDEHNVVNVGLGNVSLHTEYTPGPIFIPEHWNEYHSTDKWMA